MMVKSHHDLEVYQKAFESAMAIFTLSRSFPKHETYSLIDQIRRSSRSVCANMAEAWRKRRYHAAFVSKLNEAEAEAAETQTWLDFAVQCSYLDKQTANQLHCSYEQIISLIVSMISHADRWVLPSARKTNV